MKQDRYCTRKALKKDVLRPTFTNGNSTVCKIYFATTY